MTKKETVEHEGVVRSVGARTIEVVISSESACGGCHARGACGMSERKEKVVTAERPGFEVTAGERVTVVASMGNAFYAVLMAYVVPSVILVGGLAVLLALGMDEMSAAIQVLFACAGYGGVLYFSRDKIGRQIRFFVEKRSE